MTGGCLPPDALLTVSAAGTAAAVVRQLVALPDGYLFAAPVRARDAPEYRQYVARPMDLGSILSRLKEPPRYTSLGAPLHPPSLSCLTPHAHHLLWGSPLWRHLSALRTVCVTESAQRATSSEAFCPYDLRKLGGWLGLQGGCGH